MYNRFKNTVIPLMAALGMSMGCGETSLIPVEDLTPELPAVDSVRRGDPLGREGLPMQRQDSRGEEEPTDPAPAFQPLRVGILPDTQGGTNAIASHPMRAILEKFEDLGVDIVIPVGDLTDNGTTGEFEKWTTIAAEFRDRGMEFLPVMGNHEDSWAWTVEWIDFMKDFIPQDAYHLVGAEYLDYYVIRENVLFILLKYYHLPVAFPWIKNVVLENQDRVDHIVIASHDGLVGAKYGETREMIVEGVQGEDRLIDQWDEIRGFFSQHDVIWVQGHEHMYQRSVIRGPLGYGHESWTPADGPYRMQMYTQLVAGNASYKGYEFRYGERELVQNIVSMKMATMSNGSPAFDANATVLVFDNERVDLEAYYTEHTIGSDAEGRKELANPDWKLFDKFSRTTRRCERIVFPNSIPASTRPVMQFHPYYWSNECLAADGSIVAILDGVNETFDRVESTTRTLSWTPGFSRAQSQGELMRLAYQYLFQYHQPWTPNLNGANRIVPGANEFQVSVPETTIDLKEHVTVSWLTKTPKTLSDIVIVSGMQQQTGTFSSAYGAAKDIEVDMGLPGSQPDGTAKGPVVLPAGATKRWDLSDAVADAYALEFVAPAGLTRASSTLARRTKAGWEPVASDGCVVQGAYDSAWLEAPPARPAACERELVVGYDDDRGAWWLVLHSDVELALISR